MRKLSGTDIKLINNCEIIFFYSDDNETQNTARNEKGGTKQPAKKQDIPKDEVVEKK